MSFPPSCGTKIVHVCAGLCRFVFVPVCAGLCRFVPVCASLCQFVPVSAAVLFFCGLTDFSLPFSENNGGQKSGQLVSKPLFPQKKLYLISSRANYE